MDGCVVDGCNSNTLAIDARYTNVFATNSEFMDISNLGVLVVTAARPVDTLSFVNNTFFDYEVANFQDLGYVEYLQYDHNTSIMDCWNPFNIPQMSDGEIENNIFYGLCASGTDSAKISIEETKASALPMGVVFYLDTLTSLKSSPYNLTEADRKIVLKNNAYYWSKALEDYWSAVRDTSTVPGLITPAVFMNSFTAQMFDNHTTWPGLVAANNDNVDPGFSSALVTPAVDSLSKFVGLLWFTGTAGTFHPIPFITNPLNIFGDVAPDWATKQGYPVPENLAYTNTTLQTAGTDGFALGDLNWYPAQLALCGNRAKSTRSILRSLTYQRASL